MRPYIETLLSNLHACSPSWKGQPCPNFIIIIARRAHSNLLVLVRNKHPPAAAHDGKGLGEVIDERSDCRQHAPGRREDQVG